MKIPYNEIKKSQKLNPNLEILISELKSIFPPNQLLLNPVRVAPFTTEQRGNFISSSRVVVLPKSTEEVSTTLKVCNRLKINVIPQSGNTGLVGGTVCSNNDIILNTQNLNKIIEIDSLNQIITLQAGVTLETAINECKKQNLLFPLDLPASRKACVGGNLATNAGGISTIKYGSIRANTLGIEVVLPDGHVLRDLNKLTKRNIGPDYKHLFIGGEGILGVITAATIKLFPLPKVIVHTLLPANSLEELIEYYQRINQYFYGQLSAFEVINQAAVNLSISLCKSDFHIKNNFPWYGLCSLDFHKDLKDDDAILEVSNFFTKTLNFNPSNFYTSTAGDIWNFRKNIPKAQTLYGNSVKNDFAIPLYTMPAFCEVLTTRVKEVYPESLNIIFGHAGDNNLHFNFSTLLTGDQFIEFKNFVNTLAEKLIMEYQGNFSSEHGIGLIHREKIRKYYENNQFYMLQLLKNTLDPNNILNPNKLLLPK